MIQFAPLNTHAKQYPKPLIPILPVLDASSLTFTKNKTTGSPFLQKGIFFHNARSALTQALRLSNVDQNSAVLMPAYHCGSMIEPALWLKADVLLYKLNQNLTPDTKHIEHLINHSNKPISAILIAHYFGFLQDMVYWRTFCDKHNMTLIEDCAHSFFGLLADGSSVGTTGHYAIASVRKFFCTPDGGILIGNNIKTNTLSLKKQSLVKQIRNMLSFLQQSFYYKRLNSIGLFFTLIDNIRSSQNTPLKKQTNTVMTKSSTQQWKWFDPSHVNLMGNIFSPWFLRHSDIKQICNRRRKNYHTLLNGINNIQHLKPIFQTLDTNTVPYMFPVLLSSGEKGFDQLKRAGLPIWRWEEIAESDCQTSQNYRLQLLHLPCHQELKPTEIDWMLETLKNILGKK